MEQIETQVSDLRYLTEEHPAAQRQGGGGGIGGPSHSASALTFGAVGGGNSAHHHHNNTPLPQQPHQPARQPSTPVSPGGGGFQTNLDNDGSESGAGGGGGVGSKRKADDDDAGPGGKVQRSKRNRYISIACNECKRRKIKCNGETPCQRCGNLNLTCLYAPNCCSNSFKDSDEFKRMSAQMARLQDQVDNLCQSMTSLRSDTTRHDRTTPANLNISSAVSPSPSTTHSSMNRADYGGSAASAPRPGPPVVVGNGSFRGPTSTAFSLDIANTTIHNMGYKSLDEAAAATTAATTAAATANMAAAAGGFASEEGTSSRRLPPPLSRRSGGGGGSHDPLWEIGRDEMVRLCQLHEEEVGIMYPVVQIQTVIAHARSLASFMESTRRSGMQPDLNDDRTMQLKMVMACALLVEEHGHSDRARRLYLSMEADVNRLLMSAPSDVAALPLLALLAGFRFLSCDEILAWRVMGQVVRLCVELGIHRRSGLMKIQDEEVRQNALLSFWSAYVLDRRWAFGTGLPYAIQDDDIDPDLPRPEEYPYLLAMITYSGLGAKVWKQVSHFGPVLARELRQEDIENLDQDIIEWWESVPEEVRMKNWDKERRIASTPSYNLQRLRIWTYLRFNQIRIWLYTPILHSATSIMSNPQQAELVVSLANDTIRYLSHLNNTTNLYRKIQVFYHHFLTSAIAVVFLATVHAPVRFAETCREEFYLALDLVRDMSEKSWVSQRLWRTIRALKEVAPQIGLQQQHQQENHDAALAMAGMAAATPSNSSGGSASVAPSATAVRSPASVSQSPYPRPLLQSAPVPPARPSISSAGTHTGMVISPNGLQLQNEMRRIWEGYTGMGNGHAGNVGDASSELGIVEPGDGLGGACADGDVFQHMREMF